MNQISPNQRLANLAISRIKKRDLSQCVASHESGGNANAVSPRPNGSSAVGLWQISSVNWNSCSGGIAPCDPYDNLQCAVKLYNQGGNSFKAWDIASKCGSC